MIKAILPLFLVLLTACSFYSSSPCEFEQCRINVNDIDTIQIPPSQYENYDTDMSVYDAIRLHELNNARDSIIIGEVGDIRRNLKSVIDNIVDDQITNINNCKGCLNISTNDVY